MEKEEIRIPVQIKSKEGKKAWIEDEIEKGKIEIEQMKKEIEEIKEMMERLREIKIRESGETMNKRQCYFRY